LGNFALPCFLFVRRGHLHVEGVRSLDWLLRGAVFQVEVLHLWQVELLWSENRAWSCNSDPSDEGFGVDLVVLHSEEADEGACSSESCLAVDADCSGVWLGKVLFA